VLRPGTSRVVTWETDPADTTPNRFETWYAGVDVFVVELRAPGAVATVRARIGERLPVVVGGRTVGRIQQRVHEPNNGMNHLEIALDADAPAGAWEVELVGDDVADGRYHCWVERDAGCPHCQSLLLPADAVSTTTTGTICNGFRTIAVGAYDAHARDRPIAAFSSAGPTLDGRVKPDLVAPGLQVSGACSAGRRPDPGRPLTTRKSGTSMAAPCVAGAVCLLFEAAGRPLPIADTRRILLGSVDRVTPGADPERRYGDGYLQIAEAVAVARAHARRTTDRRAA
jgi:hypothetical protein